MGEADNYYNPNQQPPYGYSNGGGYQQQYQPQPPPATHQQQYQQPPPQQPYQQAAPQNGNGYMPAQGYGGNEKASFEEQFKIPKPKWNDLWAGILFILFMAGYIVVSGIALQGYAANKGNAGSGIYGNRNDFSLNTSTVILFMFVLAVAFVFSYAYVWMARLFPKQFIWVTGILNVCWALGTAIFYLWRRYWSAGIVFLIFGLFMAFCFWTWISRIPFSALMLRTTIDVSKKYGHVYLTSLIGGIIATAMSAWFSITLVAIYIKYQPANDNPSCADGGCGKGKVIGLIVFITFTMYWFSEWLKNTIHTTIAGVYGSWYFNPHNFPKDATRASAKRALTYSFGSIALGSLLVAIIQFVRQICTAARNQEAADGSMLGYALFCCIGCLLGILEWAVEFINRYAFCHIALYGKAYFAAAKDTWKMIKDRGIDALINDCLIGPVLSFGALFIAYACGLLAYLYLYFTDPPYNSDGQYTAVVMAFSFLIGFQIANIFTTPISSGVETIFVAAGWDPQVMWRDHPELYQEMCRVYPKVQQVIHDR
ncbi:PNS1 [Fusarium globosum]|uniref:Protein PNS1 n=1 Tax=Fusarium globosum TaxID=78864 RepID=A0A8H5YWA7_9HYPO|nr:PNS1 [Fusarium globosum]